MKERLGEIFSSYEGKTEELIPILQEAQTEFGYLPEQVMVEIAGFLRLPESRVFGVASFFAQFRFSPVGKNLLMVCRGTACHVRGAPRAIDELSRHLGIKDGETTDDFQFPLETVACLGACALAPVMIVNNPYYGKMDSKKIKSVLDKFGTETS